MDREYLFVVEGPDDEDFFRQVILPYCEQKYPHMTDHMMVKPSSTWTAQDYQGQFDIYDVVMVVIDLDPHENGCPISRKNTFCDTYRLHHKKDSVCVVIAEIESWYIATGSSGASWLPTRFHFPKSTEIIMKEDLRREVHRNRKHLSTVMQSMLDGADLANGLRRNGSLKYFLAKLDRFSRES